MSTIIQGKSAATYLPGAARSISANGTAIDTDNCGLIICTATLTLSFTAAATLGSSWSTRVYNSGSGTVTLDPNGSETINGSTTVSLGPKNSAIIVCDGSNFAMVADGTSWTLQTPITVSNASWSVPAGIKEMQIYLWGGGGSGGGRGAGAAATDRGSGGGGGSYAYKHYKGTMDSTLNITIGAGGTSVTDAAGNAGSQSSVVGSSLGTITAPGGSGGSRGSGVAGGSGGAAGTGGDIHIAGGDGGASPGTTNVFGVGGNAPMGGQGGASNVGTAGGYPGGGGSGENHTAGGSGAGRRGECWIFTR